MHNTQYALNSVILNMYQYTMCIEQRDIERVIIHNSHWTAWYWTCMQVHRRHAKRVSGSVGQRRNALRRNSFAITSPTASTAAMKELFVVRLILHCHVISTPTRLHMKKTEQIIEQLTDSYLTMWQIFTYWLCNNLWGTVVEGFARRFLDLQVAVSNPGGAT